MPTITHTDYIFQATASGVGLVPGVWVRLNNNSTLTNYFSTAVTDATSAFTHSAPPGDYSLYTGNAATVSGTPTLRNAHYSVPVTAGDDAALGSVTALSSSPYAPTASAGVGDFLILRTKTRPLVDVTHPAFGAVADGVTDAGPAINAAIAYALTLSGAVVYVPASSLAYAIGTTIVPKNEVTLQGDGVDATILKWTGATSSFLLSNGTGYTTTLNKFGLASMTLDGNNTSGVTPLGLFASQKGFVRDLQVQNIAGATTPAIRLEALSVIGNPGPLFDAACLNDFKNVTIINASYGLQLTGTPGVAPCTLNHFYDLKFYAMHSIGIRFVQTCDTNYFFATDMVFDTNNATGIKINDGANRSTVDNDAKLYLFEGLSFTASPAGNTGFTAVDQGISYGNEFRRVYVDPSFTNPTRFGGPGIRAYQASDVTPYPNQQIYHDTQVLLQGASVLSQVNQSVAFANPLVVDASLGSLVSVTGTVNSAFTISAPTNPIQGQTLTYHLTKDNTGTNYAITWNPVFKGNPQLGSDNNTVQDFSWWYDGSNWQQFSPNLLDQAGSTWAPGKVTANGFLYSLTGNVKGNSSLQYDAVGATGTHTFTTNNGGTTLATLGATGVLSTKNKIYPAQDTGAIQTVSAIYAGTGVPNNANGANGDFYFRGDTPGTANQRLYIKSAGAWVALTL